MGLQSAMTTALTGLQAAETTIDVVGNNVANSNTVGFKESNVLFATQFLQTQSIGSAPSDTRGGTNPRQIGLGTKVAAINPDFTQGTVEISANPLDVAIQGDGFLMVQGSQGERLVHAQRAAADQRQQRSGDRDRQPRAGLRASTRNSTSSKRSCRCRFRSAAKPWRRPRKRRSFPACFADGRRRHQSVE